jgi:hypothetical protein
MLALPIILSCSVRPDPSSRIRKFFEGYYEHFIGCDTERIADNYWRTETYYLDMPDSQYARSNVYVSHYIGTTLVINGVYTNDTFFSTEVK